MSLTLLRWKKFRISRIDRNSGKRFYCVSSTRDVRTFTRRIATWYSSSEERKRGREEVRRSERKRGSEEVRRSERKRGRDKVRGSEKK